MLRYKRVLKPFDTCLILITRLVADELVYRVEFVKVMKVSRDLVVYLVRKVISANLA